MSQFAARIMKNTDKDYPCVQCGSSNTSIIREGINPRIKCNQCKLTFDGLLALEAKAKNQIPEAAPELQDNTDYEQEPEVSFQATSTEIDSTPQPSVKKLPRTISYVVVSKDRTRHEFCNKKEIKKVVLRWQVSEKPYEVFELISKSVSANIDIQ